MAGFLHDPLQLINLIADNLRDRYKSGFPVLKEIIQNADDAGAAAEAIQLDFGLSPGIPDAAHPLLTGPALYFLNNGHFTRADNVAIRSFGLNRKAAEQSSIGKFGLGMKSVFHFCEAFFFVARNQDKDYAEILNPWSGGEEFVSLHADWDTFSAADRTLLEEQVRPAQQTMKRPETFFLLWLPLRKETHLRATNGETLGGIINEFPGDNDRLLAFLHEPDLPQRLAALMPLLRRITRIRFWNGQAEPAFTVTLDHRSTRISHALHEAGPGRELKGVAISTRHHRQQGENCLTSYTGRELLLDTQELRRLKTSPLWPKTFVRDEAGQSKEAPDKAQGHCAAVFTSSDEKGTGQFIANWAVFLPIDEKRSETTLCGGFKTFRLILHGYFFVDAGRADIEGLEEEGGLAQQGADPTNEAELRRSWNSQLARQGTLPLILPALAGFVGKIKLSGQECEHLSQGIATSKIFKRYREAICVESSWVCRLTRKGREWCLLPAGQTMRTLPEPPTTVRDRPWATFPQLASVEDRDVALLLKGAPHLHATPIAQWQSAELLELLRFDVRTLFTDEGRLDYLLKFLDDNQVRVLLERSDLQDHLRGIFKQAFDELGTELRQHLSKVRKFSEYLQPTRRYAIRRAAPDAILRKLQNSISSVLVLAIEFDSVEQPGVAKLTEDEAFEVLKTLDALILGHDRDEPGNHGDICRDIVRQILQDQPQDQLRHLLTEAYHLKILDGYDGQRKKKAPLSAAEITECHQAHLLFRFSSGLNEEARIGLAPKLQTAIRERLLVVSGDVIKLVLPPNEQVHPCDREGVLDALGQTAFSLHPLNKRQRLLQAAAGADLLSENQVRGLRYLLHGLPEHFKSTDPLWVSGYEESAAWGKLWKYLQRDVPNQWTAIDRKLVEKIAQDKWPILSIQEIKPKGILEEIRRVGTERVVGIELGREERDTVLREVDNDEELWKLLPLHETTDGRLVRIVPGKTFLGGLHRLPAELLRGIDLIRPSEDRQVCQSQKEWIEPIRPASAIRIALQHDTPSRFWQLILDHLDNVLNKPDHAPHEDDWDEFLEKLTGTAWLLDKDNAPVAPADVIHLQGLEDDVDRLLAEARRTYASPRTLLTDIQSHRNCATLQEHCFSSGKDGFEKLGLLLGETDTYRLGALRLPDDREQLDRMVDICSRFALPGWGLLARALAKDGERFCREFLFPELLRPIAPETIIGILNRLRGEHEQVGANKGKTVLQVFNRYLEALIGGDTPSPDLSGLTLLNGEGRWRPSRVLCAEAEGVADSHLLDKEQQRILANVITHADRPGELRHDGLPQRRDLQPEIEASVGILRTYFQEWKEIVPDELICAFLTLLGDDAGMLALAEEFRGRHTIDWIRGEIPWQVHHRVDRFGAQEWLFGVDKAQAFAMHRFIVQCTEGDEVRVLSILGEPITVPLKSRFTSLIPGGLYWESQEGERITVRMRLRSPDFQNTTPSELSGYLRASAEYLLAKEYNQQQTDLSNLWDKLDKSEQLDIRIAQQLILEHIPFYLRQLGVQKHARLQDILKRLEDARYGKIEFNETAEKKEAYEQKERLLLGELQNLLKSDQDIQTVVLDGVRKKMLDYQYSLVSIPFELFQNADDAVVELVDMQCTPSPDGSAGGEAPLSSAARRFVLCQRAESLTFAHWGRRVNEIGGSTFPGRERGFHQDLEKMLMLSSSNKSDEGKVTGKFGLGFKSVLLASDKPILVSGRLAAEIIAGLCPLPLQDAQPFRQQLSDLAPGERRRGTLIELPLADKKTTEITAEFLRLAGALTIFSRMIRRIDIDGEIHRTCEWQPETLPFAQPATLELGKADLADGPLPKRLALHFRFPEGGLLVGLGSGGFRPLEKLPAIWVVAPTMEQEGLGFAINGPFDLDAGRSRLAGNSTVNEQKGRALGRVLGQALATLHAHVSTDWPGVREQLRLEGDLTKYAFWLSLWEVFCQGLRHKDGEVYQLVTRVLCEENGLGYLINHADALPNGLWGEFQQLTRPEHIRTVLKGGLAEEKVFRKICAWEFFRDYLGDPQTVITERIFRSAQSVAPEFGRLTTQYRFVDLANVVQAFIKKEKNVSPETAQVLGGLLDDSIVNSGMFEKEWPKIEAALRDVHFQAEDGTFRTSRELLVGSKHSGANPDEGKRAAFAPARHVLAAGYQHEGLDFFLRCREKIALPVEGMVGWLRDAGTDEKRGNGLRYLLEGEHGEKVAKRLRDEGLHGTWLDDLDAQAGCFTGWEQDAIDEILYRRLKTIEELKSFRFERADEVFPGLEPLRKQDPKEVLQKIHTWWHQEKNDYLTEYEQKIYPWSFPVHFGADDAGRIDRHSWLALFLLAHLHTMGRQRDEQHRGFIDHCVQQGWWQIFAKTAPKERSDEWMGVLEQYVDAQVDRSEYEQWMNRFPVIYKLSCWLDDYQEAFLSIDRQKDLESLAGILKPRANPQFQGGGISAPPIERSLGHGACFVVRELRRKEILTKAQADPFCYVPVERVRSFCTTLGCQGIEDQAVIDNSRAIHAFLRDNLGEKRSTFAGCYDIPLQIVAGDQNLLQNILN